MAINKEKYIGKFVDEGIENIAAVESLLFMVKEGSSAEDDLTTLLRALHTLKGTSRMLEFKRIESLSHALESVFVAVREQRTALSDSAMRLILGALDLLKAGLGRIQANKTDDIETALFERELAAAAANEEFTIPGSASGEREADPGMTEGSAPPEPAGEGPGGEGENSLMLSVRSLEKQGSRSIEDKDARGGRNLVTQEKREDAKPESIRISLEKIDAIIKNTAALQSLEIAAKTIALGAEEINGRIRRFSKTIKEQGQLSPALLTELHKIEQLAGKAATTLKNHAVDVGNHTKGAYEHVISLRMLPISTILDSYPRYVFELSQELGKKVSLTIEGGGNEIDKNIIETLSDVFLHMVRNAIDHGIEAPGDRLAAGKDEAGRLLIRCSRESGNMKILICDDGRGIDYEAIREKLAEGGCYTREGAAALGREDLTNFIFQSGFSTSMTVNNLSGRGIGMDAVRASIERLKGSILVESIPGEGTTFTVLVPLSIASLMGFPIICGGMKFIIPANFVDTILLIGREEIITVVDRPGVKYENRIVKLYYLNQILKIGSAVDQHERGALFVVIIHAYDDVIALVVDSISSMRSVILKSPPSFMESLPVFSGVVLSEDYEMVPSLHMPTVIKMAKRTKTIDMKRRHIEYEKMRKSILVVDDSLPTREIEGEILRAEGYKVDTAADGSEALAAAKSNRYDLICTDLNMPIMDGFMFTENIRKNEDLAAIPIIVISSKASDEDQQRAAQLGANRYIVKNSFNNHNLLTAVRDLIGEANG